MRNHEPNPRRRIAYGALAAGALLLVLLPALATAGPHGRRGPGFGHGPGMGPGHGPMGMGFAMGRLVERLDLTEAQRDEIHGVLEARREAGAGAREEMRAARKALFEQIHAEETDEGAIRQAAADVAALEADLAVERSLTLQEVRNVLTPEQRAEARQFFDEMKDFAEERGEGFHGRGPRFGG